MDFLFYIKEENKYVILHESSINWPASMLKKDKNAMMQRDTIMLRSNGVQFEAIFVAKGKLLHAYGMLLVVSCTIFMFYRIYCWDKWKEGVNGA